MCATEVRRKSTTSSKPLAQRARRSSGGDADPRCVLVDEEGGDRQIEYKSRSSSLADEESPVLRQLQVRCGAVFSCLAKNLRRFFTSRAPRGILCESQKKGV